MFGSHLSIAGGMHLALLSAEKYQMETVRVFANSFSLDDGIQRMSKHSGTLILHAERHAPRSSPQWFEVEEVLSSLGPTACGFVSLSSPDVAYVQAAGARLRLTVEFREYKIDGSFNHWVLGRMSDESAEASINTTAGIIRLQSNEVMTWKDAIIIFREFYDHGAVPIRYARREVSDRFKDQ